MNSRHVLLLNPPGREFYTRDYFCSKVTKAGYAEHPLDLLVLSGIFSAAGFKVSVLDCLPGRIPPASALQQAVALNPNSVVFLSGLVSQSEDFVFLRTLKKELPLAVFIGIGDLFFNKGVFENNLWIDAVLYDFTANDGVDYLRGKKGPFVALSYRRGADIVSRQRQAGAGEFIIPVPRHELFMHKGYTFPFARRLPFATVLTDYGCPFTCPFCVYPTLGFRLRKMENVIEELRYVFSLGIRELFIKDQSFGADKQRSIAFCAEMRKVGRFSWTCFLRADVACDELLRSMKLAGCHSVLFGFESGSERILRSYKPGVDKPMIREALKKCRRAGIDSVGIFILGFPEDDRDSCAQTMKFALDCGCDFVSFNVFVPKAGTALRDKLVIDDGKGEAGEVLDQSGIASVWSGSAVSAQELKRMRVQAVRSFYLRPAYLARIFFKSVFSLCRLRMCLRSGVFILGDVLRRRGRR